MATFFDLIDQPDKSIKSKITGEYILLSSPPNNLKVPDDWDVKPGDVLSWSDFRATETYFVTGEHRLLKNPDTSGAGYLTIPLLITSLFPDAVNSFNCVLNSIGHQYVTSIELAPTDLFFISNFSKEPFSESIRNRNDISYSFDPSEKILYVTHSLNPHANQYFPLDTTTMNDITQWILFLDVRKTKFNVRFNFEGEEICNTTPRGIITGLPAGWRCGQKGVLISSEDKIQGEWICEGPEETRDDAQKAIEYFYRGLNIEII